MSRNLPVSAPVIEPYTGTHNEVLTRILEAQAAGRLVRTHPVQQLENGTVLVVTELRPETSTKTDEQAPAKRPGFANWPVYYWAALAPFAVAGVGVLAVLFVMGLYAVVQWGIANALLIGGITLAGLVTVLVFLGALARARHGYPAGSRGWSR